MKAATVWTPDEDNIVRKHWKIDLTARAIGELIGKSRMAVIGRAQRLGLGQSFDQENERRRNIRGQIARIARAKSKNRFPRSPKVKPPQLSLPLFREACEVPILNGVGVKIWELKSDHCRFIPGEPKDLVYCGNPAHNGSYCKEHNHFVMRAK